VQNKTKQKLVITIIMIIFAIIITSNSSFAGITPDQITGESTEELNLDFMDKLTDAISTIGIFISVGAMMIIGIRYLVGSVEEKANYKKSMMPYIIGCFILFGASMLIPKIEDLFSNLGTDTETIGNKILGIIQVVGTFISVGIFMILGIKYMVGSTEERAEYKRSMIPYIVGALLLFGAVNLTAKIYDVSINVDKEASQMETAEKG